MPFIIARYVDKATIFKKIISMGGICYMFKTLIFSPNFESLALKANQLLGYPVMALGRLPLYKRKRIDFLHNKILEKRKR